MYAGTRDLTLTPISAKMGKHRKPKLGGCMIATDYLTNLINHPSWPAAIAIAACAISLAAIVITIIWALKNWFDDVSF